MRENSGVKVAETIVGGSFGRNTMLRERNEVDLVFLLSKQVKRDEVKEYLQMQGRFTHLFTPKFEKIIDEIQRITDQKWQRLLRKCGIN